MKDPNKTTKSLYFYVFKGRVSSNNSDKHNVKRSISKKKEKKKKKFVKTNSVLVRDNGSVTILVPSTVEVEGPEFVRRV